MPANEQQAPSKDEIAKWASDLLSDSAHIDKLVERLSNSTEETLRKKGITVDEDLKKLVREWNRKLVIRLAEDMRQNPAAMREAVLLMEKAEKDKNQQNPESNK